MRVEIIVGALLAGCACCAQMEKMERRENGTPSSSWNENLLTSLYNLIPMNSGSIKVGPYFDSEGCETPIGSAFLIVEEKLHSFYTKYDRDRLYLWHKGRVMMEYVYGNGTKKEVCFGDTLEDPNCRYAVFVPSGVQLNIRSEEHVIASGVIFGGTMRNGVLKLTDVEKK